MRKQILFILSTLALLVYPLGEEEFVDGPNAGIHFGYQKYC